MPPQSREEFEIAIICALPLEADAVEALFDEHYDEMGFTYGKQKGDTNSYTTGKINDYHVVLVHPPGIGNRRSAGATRGLHISFTGIKLTLVVGICGGIPYSPQGVEILLGDIIISDSVIEYDFGRQYPHGFERKSGAKEALGAPNQEIRSFLSRLQTRRTKDQFQRQTMQHLKFLQEMEDNEWNYPGVLRDTLFEASYRHKHYKQPSTAECICANCHSNSDLVCQQALNGDCKDVGCSGDLVQRHRLSAGTPKPIIHIGTIASANSVLKSGEHRDRLFKKEGVIGFEMEGAGVWDSLPCVIIRGVCDYADSHKNKAWQNYAAATAASCTIAFLNEWKRAHQETQALGCRLGVLSRSDRMSAYEQAMKRVHAQAAEHRDLALHTISWISYAKRPLHSSELQHALAVNINEHKIDSENIVDIRLIISVCDGLVVIDAESDTVRFVHHTAEQYFERSRIKWFPDGQTNIWKTCVVYLSFDAFESGWCLNFAARRRSYPFYEYAALYWGHHARESHSQGESLILNFLQSTGKIAASGQALNPIGRILKTNLTGLHLTAYFGLLSYTLLLINKGSNIESRDSYGLTPLAYAAREGHETVVNLLIDRGSDIESQAILGGTPLFHAAREGHERIVTLLLDRGADIESRDMGRTPLTVAAEKSKEAVVNILLDRGADIESEIDRNGNSTPLMSAACHGNEAVVNLLLDRGAHIESRYNDGWTPLMFAIQRGRTAIVKLLFERGAHIESQDKGDRIPLILAAQTANEELINLLLDKGADIESRGNDGWTPLMFAIQRGCTAVAKLLLERGANIESRENDGWTPLILAAQTANEELINLLLDRGADIDSRDNDGKAPLTHAAEYGHEVVETLLLKRGASIEWNDDLYDLRKLFYEYVG